MKWIIIVIILGGLFFAIYPFGYRTQNRSEFYDLGYLKAPIGIFWVGQRGVFIFGCGGVSSKLEEIYATKYFVGNELHTKLLKSETTPIIADGTFRLEVIIAQYEGQNVFGMFHWTDNNMFVEGYRIHIPEFPKNDNVTEQWLIKQN